MVQTVHRYNERGFTLLEAMIAVLILTVMMMWSLQGLVTVTRTVSNNKIRMEAVKLGQELLVDARAQSYVALPVNPSTGPATSTVARQIASYDINFTVIRDVIPVPGSTGSYCKWVKYTIGWDNGRHSYVAQTVVSNQ